MTFLPPNLDRLTGFEHPQQLEITVNAFRVNLRSCQLDYASPTKDRSAPERSSFRLSEERRISSRQFSEALRARQEASDAPMRA